MWRGILMGLAFMLLAACSGGAARDTSFVIPEGTSVARAAEIMAEAGAIGDPAGFMREVRLLGSDAPIKPGEYAVEAGTGALEVYALIQSGRTVQRFVMIPEGMPSVMVHDRLMATAMLTGAIPVPPEGSILPNTYAYVRGESRAAVVARMQAAMDRAWSAAWAQRSPRSVVRNRNDAVTLASIIEKETAKPAERRRVAGVYTNRLRAGERLQADPTAIYLTTRGRRLGRAIRQSELDAVNVYNTYAMAGLPVGPITNPGRSSLMAALNPEVHDYKFFVADGSGGHVFSRTYAEHRVNHRRWRVIREARAAAETAE